MKYVRLHQCCGSMRPMSCLNSSPQASSSHCRCDSLQSFLGQGVVGSMSAAEKTQRRKEHSWVVYPALCVTSGNWNETQQRWMFMADWLKFLNYLWAVMLLFEFSHYCHKDVSLFHLYSLQYRMLLELSHNSLVFLWWMDGWIYLPDNPLIIQVLTVRKQNKKWLWLIWQRNKYIRYETVI